MELGGSAAGQPKSLSYGLLVDLAGRDLDNWEQKKPSIKSK
jgi:hypothetical protein